MSSNEQPFNELEQAIAAVADAGEDADGSARSTVLSRLAAGSVTVLMSEAPAEDGAPAPNARTMLVSDGPNREQPMLAVFSRRDRAQEFQQSQNGGMEHPAEVPGVWAVLATPENAGIVINPNQGLGFRIPPQVATILREDVDKAVADARTRQAEQE